MGRALYVVVFPFFVEIINQKYGWRTGLKFLAVLPLIMIFFTFYFATEPCPEEEDKPENLALQDSDSKNSQSLEAAPKKPQFDPNNIPELEPEKKRLLKLCCIGVVCSFLAMGSGRTLFVTYADQKFSTEYTSYKNLGNGTQVEIGTFYGDPTNPKTAQYFASQNITYDISRESVMSSGQRAALISAFNLSSVGIRIVIIIFKDLIINAGIKAGDLWYFGGIGCMMSFGSTPVLSRYGPNGLIAAAIFQGLTLGVYQGQPITVLR